MKRVLLFFRYAFVDNRWVWFHTFAGVVAAKVLSGFLSADQVVVVVFVVALLYELVEIGMVSSAVSRVYGDWFRLLADSFGDVMGAVIGALVYLL